jgi:SAM-dependent methyltransferase
MSSVDEVRVTMTSDYQQHSTIQKNALVTALQQQGKILLKHLSDKLKQEKKGVLSCADFGCATGQNTIPLIQLLLESKDLASRQLEVQLFSCDLLENDWIQVFNSYNALKERDEKARRQLYQYSVAGSFFNQLLPTNSLDFSFSASAFQFLDTSDAAFVQGIREIKALELPKYKSSDRPQFGMFLQSSFYDSHQDLIKKKAKKDWDTIMSKRAMELQKGGILMMVLLCSSDKDKFKENFLLNLIDKSFQYIQHLLHEEEKVRLFHPTYMRTEEEYLDFEASRLFEVIDIKHMEFCNPQTFGRSSSPSSFIRAISYNCILSCLSAQRDEKEKTEIIELFYNKLDEMFTEEHNSSILEGIDYVCVLLKRK